MLAQPWAWFQRGWPSGVMFSGSRPRLPQAPGIHHLSWEGFPDRWKNTDHSWSFLEGSLKQIRAQVGHREARFQAFQWQGSWPHAVEL